MATLFWFLTGLAICIGVARYNEEDNLFWKLAVAFIGSFAAATVVKTVMENNNQEKVVVVENAPTQALESTSCNFYTVTDVSLATPKREKSPKPVSKDSLLDENDSLLSKVHASVRGQPYLCTYYDDS